MPCMGGNDKIIFNLLIFSDQELTEVVFVS
jgi:hypothetical protein